MDNTVWAVGRAAKVIVIIPFAICWTVVCAAWDLLIDLAYLPQDIGEELDCLETDSTAS